MSLEYHIKVIIFFSHNFVNACKFKSPVGHPPDDFHPHELPPQLLASQLTAEGDVSVARVSLNAERINRLLEESDLPFELVDGYVRHLSVSVPWSTLLSDDCRFAVDGLTVTVQVRQRRNPAQISASIFHSMCESFSPMNLAEDCFRTRLSDEEEEEEEGDGGGRAERGRRRAAGEEKDFPGDAAGAGAKVIGVEVVAQAIDSVISR